MAHHHVIGVAKFGMLAVIAAAFFLGDEPFGVVDHDEVVSCSVL